MKKKIIYTVQFQGENQEKFSKKVRALADKYYISQSAVVEEALELASSYQDQFEAALKRRFEQNEENKVTSKVNKLAKSVQQLSPEDKQKLLRALVGV